MGTEDSCFNGRIGLREESFIFRTITLLQGSVNNTTPVCQELLQKIALCALFKKNGK